MTSVLIHGKAPDRPWRLEWGTPHRYASGRGIRTLYDFDSWSEIPADKPFYSSALPRECSQTQRTSGRTTTLFAGHAQHRVEAPMIEPDEILAIAGEGGYLGDWDPSRAIRMNDSGSRYGK